MFTGLGEKDLFGEEDFLTGGRDFDTLITLTDSVDLTAGTADYHDSYQLRFSGIEGVSALRSDNIKGDDNDNILYGGGGSDTISGEGGDDKIFGDAYLTIAYGRYPLLVRGDAPGAGPGQDRLDGGAGLDTVYGGPRSDVCFSAERSSGCEG